MIIGFGDKNFERKVNWWERKVIARIKGVIAETAEMAAAQMKALAPVDEGALKDSIEITYSKNGLRAHIKVNSFYGVFIEYGTGIYSSLGTGRKEPWVYYKNGRYYFTRGIHPQPFFHPSVEVSFKHFRDEMNKIG
jgi:HK97 gp10 family phage protein